MRSRYTAFCRGAIDYIEATHHPKHRADFDRAETETWASESTWEGLHIRETERGTADDEDGIVEFVATYVRDGQQVLHHERSVFERLDGRWYFVDGEPPKPTTTLRTGPKIGRNDACPCGSGKKYKKCCGAN